MPIRVIRQHPGEQTLPARRLKLHRHGQQQLPPNALPLPMRQQIKTIELVSLPERRASVRPPRAEADDLARYLGHVVDHSTDGEQGLMPLLLSLDGQSGQKCIRQDALKRCLPGLHRHGRDACQVLRGCRGNEQAHVRSPF
ncbi:hypothetical protein D3C79_905290 [compost metagenome]